MPKQPGHRRPLIEAIEPRLLFSATADIAVFDDHHHTDLTTAAHQLDLEQVYLQQEQLPPLAIECAQPPAPIAEEHNLVFIDTTVTNYQTLVKDILANPSNKDAEIIYLNPQENAITQITNTLDRYANVDAVHIISHGDAGVLEIGSQVLTDGNIKNYQQELNQWSHSLTKNADILLYGCNLAANPAGVALMQQLSQLTGADVAASTDITGSKSANGDWLLEKSVGQIEHNSLIAMDQQTQWQGDLSTTVYATSGSTASTQVLSPGQNLYQSFTYTSGNGTYSVDAIRMMLARDAFAQVQTVTVELSATLNGAAIASNTISSASIGTSLSWKTFDISGTTLTDGQTYYIKINTSGNDGLVTTGIINSNTYAGGSLFYDSLTPDANRELSFEISNTTGDTNYIGTVNGNNQTSLSSSHLVGQSFSYNSGSGSYSVNEVSLYLARYANAAAQTVTAELRDAWNGAVLGSASLASNTINSDGFDWYSFDFSNVSLTDNQSYVIQISSSGSDDLVLVGYKNSDVASGAMILNGTPNASGWDLAYKVSNEDGSNAAPTLDHAIADINLRTEQGLNFTVPANTFSDPDANDTISYRAQLAGGGSLDWLQFNMATHTFWGTPHFNQIGTLHVQLIATDNHGVSTSDYFDVITTNANTLDNPIADQTIQEGTALNFTFPANTFSNFNGDTLTYTAVQSNNAPLPAWLHFNAATRTFSGTADDGDVGTKTIKVTADDGHGGTVSDTFDVVVTPLEESPFVITPIPDQTGTGYVPFNFTFGGGTFGDPDIGDSLTYSAQLNGGGALPAWLNFNAATRTFSGTPTNADAGVIAIDVTADDSHGGTVTDTFNITIGAGNTPPVNTVPGAQSVNEDTALVFSAGNGNHIQITDVDAGGSSVKVTLSVTHGTLSLSGTTGLTFTTGDGTTDTSMVFTGSLANINTALTGLNYTANANFFGSDTLTVLTDDQGNTGAGGAHTDSDTVAITINSVNDAPTVANAIANQNATEDSAFNFQFASNTFTDADAGYSLTCTAQLNGGGALPAWLNFNSATRTFSGTPANADVGAISIDVIADDGNGGTVTDTFDIVVANTNDAPTIANALIDQNANEDAAFNFQFPANTFNDVDAGSSLTYTAQLNGGGALPAWLNFNAATRTFSGTPANADVGTISIDVTADDGNGGIVTDTFNIVIANTNDAPTVANAIPNQNATEDSAFNFQFASNAFNDVDVGNTLTYSAQLNGGGALPAWLNFNAATRTFSGTPANADVGTISIDVTADDGNGGTVTDTFDITIANTNDAPTVANALIDQNATEDAAFNFQFPANTFNDVDAGSSLTYTAQLNGGGALPAWLNFNAATRTFSGTPANADVGTISIDITADDGNGGTVTDTFNIVVANTNDAPTIANAIADQNTTENSAFNFQFPANTFNDVDAGSSLTYSAQLNGGGALPAWLNFNAATRTFSGIPTHTDIGSISIDVIANDGNGGTITDTFNITIAQLNSAPTVINAIPDQQASGNSAFSFQFAANTFNDSDVADTLNYSAQLTGGGALPSWLQFNAATRTFSGTPTNNDLGSLNIDVTASDGHGGTVTDTFIITVVNANHGPIVANAIPDQTTRENSLFNFQFASNTFTDADTGNNLNYSAQLHDGSALPSWLTFDTNTRTFSGTPTHNDLGVITLDVTADDGNGGTITDSFTITVANINRAPSIENSIADQQATEDSAFNFQIPSNTFGDADGDTLTYSAQLNGGGALPSWLSFNSATKTFTGTPTNDDVGSIAIDVIVNDANGGTATDTFMLIVANTNDAPILIGTIANQDAVENSTFKFQIPADIFKDVDAGDNLTYSARLSDGGSLPSWLHFDSQTKTFSGTPTFADKGELVINIIATDSDHQSANTNFTLQVTPLNQAPASTGIKDIHTIQGSPPGTLDLATIFSDREDGHALRYSLVSNSNPLLTNSIVFDSQTNQITLNYNSFASGQADIVVRATDTKGAFIDSTVRLAIAPLAPKIDNVFDDLDITKLPNEKNTVNINPIDLKPIDVQPIEPKSTDLTSVDTSDSTHTNTNSNPSKNDNSTNDDGNKNSVTADTNESNSGEQIDVSDLNHSTTSPTDPVHINPDKLITNIDQKFDPNRYERISQYETQLKKANDQWLSHSAMSSLILPYEGFSTQDLQDLASQLRKVHHDMDEAIAHENQQKMLITGITLSVTTGVIIWTLRASSLLLTLFSMLPLWRGIDPLPILQEVEKRKKQLEEQRKDKKMEDKNSKEVGYLFDKVQTKNPGDQG